MWVVDAGRISPQEASVNVKRIFLLFFILSFDRTCNFNTCFGHCTADEHCPLVHR